MKTKLLLLFIIYTFCGSFNLRAAKVEIADARKAALNVYNCKAVILNHELKALPGVMSEYTMESAGYAVYYVFNMTTGGWVIMSADDRVTPVLAFSSDGNIDPSKGSPEFKWMLDGYAQQIQHVIENDISSKPEIKQQWQQWLSGNFDPAEKGAKSMLPLLTSTWDQGKYYNMFCPEDPDGPDGRVWSGCVATCMAQVMYYYRYPVHGTGIHGYYSNYGYLSANFGATTYQWDAMEDNISNTYNEPMAELQYHCGIAVDMNYSPSGSGASMWSAAQALIDYFGYSSSLHLEQKDDYTDAQWKTMLKTELDNKHPLCYAGYGNAGGHAFVCDGYEGTEHFHFNWGWSGYADGYFYVSDLNPLYDFTNGQQAIFGMVPASGYPYGCAGTKTLTSVRGTFEDGSGPAVNYASNSDCMYLIDPDVNVADIILSFSRFETESTNDVVTIYDGASTSDPVLGIYSGNTLPPTIQSTGNKMLVRFTTNGSANAPGWFASYHSHYPVYCNSLTELTAPSGSFSDGSGSNPYNNSTQCRWRIAPPGATGITINFSSFDMEGNDFVKIYDEVQNIAVATFYGTTLPNSVFVFTSKVFIFFKSDNYGTSDGFEATYTSSTSGISGNSPLTGLCIYPNPADDFLHINSGIASNDEIKLRLFTPTGTEVLNQMIIPENGVLNEMLDVSGLSQGLYFLIIETPSSRQTVPVTKE